MALLKIIGIKSIIQAVTVMRNSWCLFGLAGQMKMTSEDEETSSRFSGDYEKCPSSAIHCQRVWANTLDSDRLGWQTQAMRLCLFGPSRAESVWALVQGPAVVHEIRWGAERTKWKSFWWWMCLSNQGHTRCIVVCSYNRLSTPVGRQKMAYEMIQNNLLVHYKQKFKVRRSLHGMSYIAGCK